MSFHHIPAVCEHCKKIARTVGVGVDPRGYVGIEYVCSCRKAGTYTIDLQDFLVPDALIQRRPQ